MTRFGVMKHLKVLEEAGLVVARKQGREKLHFLNPVPIRLIHDRWIDKYTEQRVSALADLKTALEGMERHVHRDSPRRGRDDRQVHRVYITAPATGCGTRCCPEWSDRYGYGGYVQSDLRAGGAFFTTADTGQDGGMPAPTFDGEVVESDPPNRLVQTWRMLMDDGLAAEGFTRLTYELARPTASPG